MSLKEFLNKPIVQGLKDKAGTAAMITLGLGALAAGFKGIEYVRSKLIRDPKRLQILEELVMEDPILRDSDPNKLLEYYSVIYHAAPSITLNKGALREPLRNFIRFDKVDLATLKTLTEIEEKYTKAQPSSSVLNMVGDAGKLTGTVLGIAKSSSAPEDVPLLKEAAASIYKHAKNKERYYKGAASLNYFKSKGVL